MTSNVHHDNPLTTGQPAVLVLADGHFYRGRSFGYPGDSFGEAVFCTGMTGYQETLTDPSYHRQIVVAAAPQIGNTGWNDEDDESRGGRIWVSGLVVRDVAHRPSSWRCRRSLGEVMEEQHIPGICQIDTRALVRHLRNHGSIAAGIFVGDSAATPIEELVAKVAAQPPMKGASLSAEVTTPKPYIVEPDDGQARYTVVAFDLGIKSMTPRNFAARGIRTVIVPGDTSFETVVSYQPDGVFVSNGPGDPATADAMVQCVREVLTRKLPFFGICFGNQILGRALGLDTYKLTFGHRGINVPVKNHDTGEITITAQNHGFAVDAPTNGSFNTPFGPAHVTHTCLNDGVVEGLALDDGLAFSVQYHPEAAAGPHDANSLFDQFVSLLDRTRAAGETLSGQGV